MSVRMLDGDGSESQADIALQILAEAANVRAGNLRPDQCRHLSALSAYSRCAWGRQMPLELEFEGCRYRTAVRGRLFIYAQTQTPLLPDGEEFFSGLLPR